MGRIKFGTDGWRAVISEDFTYDNVKVVAQSIADYVKAEKKKLKQRGSVIYGRRYAVVVGYDTRFLSEKYAELIACVLAGNGIKVVLADRPTPTPSVSFKVKNGNYIGGVMVTASHNPARYNGIKYKGYFGGSVGRDITDKLESRLYKSRVRFIGVKDAVKGGLIKIENIIPYHLKRVVRYADMRLLKKARLKVLVDSMNGTGAGYIAELLKGTRIKVTTINDIRDTYFGGRSPEPNETHLATTAALVKKGGYDVGLATDGDADRLGVILPNGKVLSGHKVMTLLLLHLLEDRGMTGDVVQTICGTGLINKICKRYGLHMHETAVGFKYIADIFNTQEVLVGGEETGGVAFKGWLPERDGVLSGLLILETIVHRKKGLTDILHDINREYGQYLYKRYDLKFSSGKKKRIVNALEKHPFRKILGKPVVDVKSFDGFKFIRSDGSWLMLRLSGTEPKLRIYSEGHSEKDAVRLIEFGKAFARGI
jgi:phosphomannomutase